MKQSNTRLHVTLSLDKAQPRHGKGHYRPKPLKSLSTRLLWILIESIDSQLKNNSLFLTKNQLRALRKRHRDLSTELNERIEYDEYLCALRDAQNPLGLDPNISEARSADENPNRKGKGKVYIKGSRLRPGRKMGFCGRARKKSFVG